MRQLIRYILMPFLLVAFAMGSHSVVAQSDGSGQPDPLEGWGKAGYNTEQYQTGFLTKLSTNGRHLGFIKAIDPGFRSFATLMRSANIEELRGKRIQLKIFIKTEKARSVGAWFRVENDNKTLVLDNMSDRRITGTKDWKEVSLVLDIPDSAKSVSYGVLLEGSGQVWFETPTFHIVDQSVRTTNRSRKQLKPLDIEKGVNRLGLDEPTEPQQKRAGKQSEENYPE